MTKRAVALNPLAIMHYTDHLAAIAAVMDIPLVLADNDACEQARRLYPDVKVEYVAWEELTRDYIAEHFDAVFVSDMFGPKEIESTFGEAEERLHKKMRAVHVPHGFSDKVFWFDNCRTLDICLVYGQNMLDLILRDGLPDPLPTYIVTGNFRYLYYKKHKTYFDSTIQEDILSHFAKKQKTILYAPTWQDSEDSSSFFHAADQVLDELPPEYNLIVKLHPHLELDDVATLYQIMAKHDTRPNVVFLNQYPPVYPVLAAADIYIGDRSAIGYDFLTFKRPMFFLDHLGQDSPLFKCGTVIKKEQFGEIYNLIEQSLPHDEKHFKDVRNQVYEYTFGAEKSFEELKREITKAYDSGSTQRTQSPDESRKVRKGS